MEEQVKKKGLSKRAKIIIAVVAVIVIVVGIVLAVMLQTLDAPTGYDSSFGNTLPSEVENWENITPLTDGMDPAAAWNIINANYENAPYYSNRQLGAVLVNVLGITAEQLVTIIKVKKEVDGNTIIFNESASITAAPMKGIVKILENTYYSDGKYQHFVAPGKDIDFDEEDGVYFKEDGEWEEKAFIDDATFVEANKLDITQFNPYVVNENTLLDTSSVVKKDVTFKEPVVNGKDGEVKDVLYEDMLVATFNLKMKRSDGVTNFMLPFTEDDGGAYDPNNPGKLNYNNFNKVVYEDTAMANYYPVMEYMFAQNGFPNAKINFTSVTLEVICWPNGLPRSLRTIETYQLWMKIGPLDIKGDEASLTADMYYSYDETDLEWDILVGTGDKFDL